MSERTGAHSGGQVFAERALAVDVKVIAHEAPRPKQTESTSLLATSNDLVTVVADLRVLDALLVVLPEALNTPSALVLITHVVAERTLDPASHVVPVAVPHGLQSEKLVQYMLVYMRTTAVL